MNGAVANGPILSLRNLSAGYGDEPIVADVSLDIEARTITTIVGSNGAGKSTLLKALYGLNRRFAGTILLQGQAIEDLSPIRRLEQGLAFVPQGRCNFPLMSVRENLSLGAYGLAREVAARRLDGIFALFPVLAAKPHVAAGNLSGGEQQILEMAMVLVKEPQVLLLDEPSIGLSPKNLGIVLQVVRDIQSAGTTIIMVEQNVKGALSISDTAVVMELGRVIAVDTPARIIGDPTMSRAYLGRRTSASDA